MSGDPLVKVVLTCFNRREWARQALESVLEQTYANLQVVAVDDGSSDGTADMLRGYAQAQPARVTLIAKGRNRGVGDSIRVGLEAAPDADYVAFMNDDDVWLPEKIERQLARLQAGPGLGMSITDAFCIDAGGARTGERLSQMRAQPLDLQSISSFGVLAYASSLTVRRDVAERLRRTMPSTTTWDWYVMLVAAGMAPIERIDEPLFELRRSPGSLSSDLELLHRDEVATFEWFVKMNPDLLAALGGVVGGRRQVAGLAAWRALLAASAGAWGTYLGYARIVVRQRQASVALGLMARTTLALLRVRSYS